MEQKRCSVWSSWQRRWVMAVVSLTVTLCTHLWVLALVGVPGRRGAALFKWHPILMSFATMMVLPCGIFSWLLWRDSESSRSGSAESNNGCCSGRLFFKALHVVCVIWAFIMMSIGIAIAYVSHVEQGFANLYSFHSWMGALTMVMMKVNIVGGVCGSVWRQAHDMLGGGRHRMVGIVSVGMGFASATLGFAEYQTFIVRDKGPWSAAAIFACILASASCLLGACYVIEVCTGTADVEANHRGMVATATVGKVDADAHSDTYGVPVISNVDTETRELSSGSGTSS